MDATMKMKAAAGLCLVLLIGFSTAARSAQMETPFTVVNRYKAPRTPIEFLCELVR